MESQASDGFLLRPIPARPKRQRPDPPGGAIHRCRACPTPVPCIFCGPSHTGRAARLRVWGGPVYPWKLADAGPLSVASIAVAPGISQKKKPAMRLGGPWPWQGSMVGGQWPKGAQHQTHALQGPPRNTAGFLLIVCRHGATRNDRPMVSLKVLSVQLFAVRSSSSRSSAKSASIRSISIRWRALRSTSSG